MRQNFKIELSTISILCIILWCFTASPTTSTEIHSPRVTRQVSNQNFTEGEKYILRELQKSIDYTIRVFFYGAFSGQYQTDKPQIVQETKTRVQKSTRFFCNTNGTRSSKKPTSVHKLRPGDIDVVGSIGDSLTVGSHRTTSFSAGGQGTWREFLTLPNIIKEFNPRLIGYAHSESLQNGKEFQFNVAEIGARSRDAPFMTKELVKRIKLDQRININQDWKLITIFIGLNTYCADLCRDDHTLYAEYHRIEITNSLLYIKRNLPRTIINLILTPNLKILLGFKNLPSMCSITHLLECPCLYDTQYERQLLNYINVMNEFQKVEKEIVENVELKNTDDFTVVLQPFTEHLKFPVNRFNTTDLSYLSSDCFHFSQKGYARMANALWNNMMEPVGRKSTNWSKEFDRFVCPTKKSPYIRTWKNSMK